MKYVITHEEREYELTVVENSDGVFEVELDGETVHADFRRASNQALYSLVVDGRSYELLIVNGGAAGTSIIQNGRSVDFQVESERAYNARLIASESEGATDATVRAHMPGIVVSIAVSEDDQVTKGDPILVLEAMKMENEIKATSTGRVTAIPVKPGQTVNAGDALVEISPD